MAQEEFAGTSRFQVVAKIGAGGMGVVYRVHDQEQDRDVALKTLQRFDATELYRFKHEFRALADVAHPNLVSLYELVFEGNRCFFTMELLDGVSLQEWVWRSNVQGLDAPLSGAISSSDQRRIPTLSRSTPTGPVPDPIRAAEPVARPTPACDFDRLRSAFRQLVLGVGALHRAGRLHRDIKPSNVLVTRDGRVVLLDFGLVTDRTLVDLRDSICQGVIGTPAYMSPEQAAREKIGPASDLYGVGVILFELLTGRLPFEGTVLEVLDQKQRCEPPPPSAFATVPGDLDTLCVALLRRLPGDRPDGAEVLARLAAAGQQRVVGQTAFPATPFFVGRRPELEALAAASVVARQGGAVIVHVHGASGMGKTALVERFLEAMRADSRTTILSGRCYERESVPYKALDSVIDALSRHLRQLGPEAAAMLPRDVRPLVRLFPVLKQADAVAQAPQPSIEIPDPQELRRRAFRSIEGATRAHLRSRSAGSLDR